MTAPSTAFGRSAIGPVRKSSTSTIAAAASRPAIWLRAPIASLTAVREPLAPTGRPCVTPGGRVARRPSRAAPGRRGRAGRGGPRTSARSGPRRRSETRNMPTAAGSSVSASSDGGVGTLQLGQPGRDVADDGDAVRPRGRATPRRRSRRRRRSAARRAPAARGSAGPAGSRARPRRRRASRRCTSPSSRHDLDELRQRVARRRSSMPEQLAELADHEHDGDAVDVADEHRPREVVGDPAEPQQPRDAGSTRRRAARASPRARPPPRCPAAASASTATPTSADSEPSGPDDQLPRRARAARRRPSGSSSAYRPAIGARPASSAYAIAEGIASAATVSAGDQVAARRAGAISAQLARHRERALQQRLFAGGAEGRSGVALELLRRLLAHRRPGIVTPPARPSSVARRPARR